MTNVEFTIEELSNEEWRPVVGYEGIYSVSNLGRVRRDLQLAGARAGRILSHASDAYGYPRACLSKNGKHHTVKVHHLVAHAFIGERPDGLTVNHKDGNKKNNRTMNLEYCSSGDNSRHAGRMGLLSHGEERSAICRRVAPRGEENHKAKLTAEQVREIRNKAAARTATQEALAREYGIHHSTLQRIVYRKSWTHI